jgi:hypothetical protein
MFDKLEQLRAKPPHIKKHIAFWSSLGITAVILVFWVTSLSVTLNNQAVAELDGDVYVNQSNGQDVTPVPAADVASAPSPAAAMTASVANAFAPVGALIKSFVGDLSSATQPPATSSAVEIYAAPSAQDGQNAPMESTQ